MTTKQKKEIASEYMIESLTREHGLKIVKFFESAGCLNPLDLKGRLCKEENDSGRFYYYNSKLQRIDNTNQSDLKPLITLEEFKKLIEDPKSTFTPLEEKLMYVSDVEITNLNDCPKRFVFGKKNDKFLAWKDASDIEEANNEMEIIKWNYVKEIPEAVIITEDEAKEIIKIACNPWKEKLFDLWGKQIVFNEDIFVTREQQEEFLKASNKDQQIVLARIFNK